MAIKLKNKERFFLKLREVVPQVDSAILSVNKQSANAMAELARRLAPVGDGGTLRDSIRVGRSFKTETGYIVQAGGPTTTKPVRDGADASYDYAVGQELGTRKMPANPFFWPAYRVVKRSHRGRMTRAIRKAVKGAGF